MNTCSKCGGRLARPQIEPDLKPYYVFYHMYDHPRQGPVHTRILVYAVDELHAYEIAPQLSRVFGAGTTTMPIDRVEAFK